MVMRRRGWWWWGGSAVPVRCDIGVMHADSTGFRSVTSTKVMNRTQHGKTKKSSMGTWNENWDNKAIGSIDLFLRKASVTEGSQCSPVHVNTAPVPEEEREGETEGEREKERKRI